MRKFIDIVSDQPPIVPVRSTNFLSLLEAARSYEEMLDTLEKFVDALGDRVDFDRGDFLQVIRSSKAVAKRFGNGRNLATWIARQMREAIIMALINHLGKDRIAAFPEDVDTTFNRYTKKVLAGIDIPANFSLPAAYGLLELIGNTISHARTIDYAPIQNYNYTTQSYIDVRTDLEDLERTYVERSNVNRHVDLIDDDKVVLKLPNNFAWVILNRKSCRVEGKAMSHCGNTALPRNGQRILSLREFIGDGKWIPHATFILNPDGTLGERKGYQNHKLAPKFYQYVVPLYKQKWIRGLVDGAHWSHNDLSLADLPDDMANEVIKANPMIVGIENYYSTYGMTDDLIERIATGVKELGRDSWFRLNRFSKFADIFHSDDLKILYDRHPELMTLEARYHQFGLNDELLKTILDGFQNGGRKYIAENGIYEILSQEDKYAVWDADPRIMTRWENYERFGMSEELMEDLREEVTEGAQKDAYEFIGSRVSPEDKQILYARHPETMRPDRYLSIIGLDEKFIKVATHGISIRHLNWFTENSIGIPIDKESNFTGNRLLKQAGPAAFILDKDEFRRLFADGNGYTLCEILPYEYYLQYGIKDRLIDKISQLASDHGYYYLTREFALENMKQEDYDTLIRSRPALMTGPDYYRINGLNRKLEEYLTRHINSEYQIDRRNRDNEYETYAMLDFSKTKDIDVRDLRPEDRDQMFDAYPELMTFLEHYDRRGVDEDLLEQMDDDFVSYGHPVIKGQYAELMDTLKPEDKEKMFTARPQFAPFTVQLERLDRLAVFDNMVAELEKIEDYPFHISNFRLMEGNDDLIQFDAYKDVSDLIDELGSDDLKTHGTEDRAFDYYNSDTEVEQSENFLPISVRMAIVNYVNKTYVADQINADDEEMDEVSLGRWSEVIEYLDDNGDELLNALSSGVYTAEGVGAQNEAHEAVINALNNIECDYGSFMFTRTGTPPEHIQLDGEVNYVMTFDEAAKWFDEVDSSGYCGRDSKKEFLANGEIRMAGARYGFSGFDAEAGYERFKEEAPEELLENIPANPYKEKGEWKDVPDEEMRSACAELLEKHPKGFGFYGKYEFDRADDSEKLTKVFRKIMTGYYPNY